MLRLRIACRKSHADLSPGLAVSGGQRPCDELRSSEATGEKKDRRDEEPLGVRLSELFLDRGDAFCRCPQLGVDTCKIRWCDSAPNRNEISPDQRNRPERREQKTEPAANSDRRCLRMPALVRRFAGQLAKPIKEISSGDAQADQNGKTEPPDTVKARLPNSCRVGHHVAGNVLYAAEAGDVSSCREVSLSLMVHAPYANTPALPAS